MNKYYPHTIINTIESLIMYLKMYDPKTPIYCNGKRLKLIIYSNKFEITEEVLNHD